MTTDGTPTVRLPWVDTARGAAIVLVITHHAVLFATAEELGNGAWTAVNETLRLVRMPLFFFLSGLLAANAAHRPWRELLLRRTGNDLWVYLVWATTAFAVFSLVPYARDDLPSGIGGWLEATVLLPTNGAWYLLALALFLVLARTLRRVPTSALLAAAALVSAAFGPGPLVQHSFVWNDCLTLFVFFAAGTRLRTTTLRALATTPRWPLTLLSVALVGALALGVTGLGLTRVPGVRLLIGALAVAAGLLLAHRLADTAADRGLANIGRRTLPVYVTHEIVLGILVLALAPLAGNTAMSYLAPVLLVTAALAVCLPLRTPLARVPGLLRAPWVRAPEVRIPAQGRRAAVTPAPRA